MIYAWNHMLLPYQAVTSFLQEILTTKALQYYHCVNALSGCYLISTFTRLFLRTDPQSKVSMPSRAVTSFLQHCRKLALLFRRHVSMPSRAVTSFLHAINVTSGMSGRDVSMPSRAVTSFLQYHFKNLGFMRLPEPVFAGIYQNILTTAVFRAC